MNAYHVDRSGTLQIGQTIDYITLPNTSSYGFTEVSFFGKRNYDFMNNLDSEHPTDSLQNDTCSYNIDLSSEAIRQSHFPFMPSRFKCLFGLENLSDLITWKDLLTSNPNANVYKVSFESTPVKLDANLLRGIPIDPPDIKVATINSFNCLYQYWTGTPSDNPVWELLLPLPVKVIEKVDNSVISNLFI